MLKLNCNLLFPLSEQAGSLLHSTHVPTGRRIPLQAERNRREQVLGTGLCPGWRGGGTDGENRFCSQAKLVILLIVKNL